MGSGRFDTGHGKLKHRWIRVFMLLIAAGSSVWCQGNKAVARPDDEAVMETVLLDYLHYNGQELSSLDGSSVVVLARLSPEKIGMAMPDQVNQYLRRHKVPDKLVQALYNRNNAGKDFRAIRMDFSKFSFDKAIQVRAKLPGLLDSDGDETRWLESYAPGYSSDRKTAVVRSWIGPTPHGAIATYLLRRVRNSWQVEWREFTFFV